MGSSRSDGKEQGGYLKGSVQIHLGVAKAITIELHEAIKREQVILNKVAVLQPYLQRSEHDCQLLSPMVCSRC